MVGKRAVKSGFIIEFIADSDPTLQITPRKKGNKNPLPTRQTYPYNAFKMGVNAWFRY